MAEHTTAVLQALDVAEAVRCSARESALSDQRERRLAEKLEKLQRDNIQLSFLNRQADTQVSALLRRLTAQERQLKELRRCGACRCLAETRKQPLQPKIQLARGRHSRSRGEDDVDDGAPVSSSTTGVRVPNGRRSASTSSADRVVTSDASSGADRVSLTKHQKQRQPTTTDVASSSSAAPNWPQIRATADMLRRSTAATADTNTVHQPNGHSDKTTLQEQIDELKHQLRLKEVELESLRHSSGTSAPPQLGTSSVVDDIRRKTSSTDALLADKDREIDRLRSQVADLVAENVRLKQTTVGQPTTADGRSSLLTQVQQKLTEFERELKILRLERQRLEEQNLILRESVNSKETNLQRCERELTNERREVQQLRSTVHVLKEKGKLQTQELDHLQAEVRAAERRTIDAVVDTQEHHQQHMRRARSEAQLHRSKSRSPSAGKHRSVNPYCPVCREYREQLEMLAANGTVGVPPDPPILNPLNQFTSSPDSGFADKATNEVEVPPTRDSNGENQKLTKRIRQLEMENRLLQYDKDALTSLNESSNTEAERLRRQRQKSNDSGGRNKTTEADHETRLMAEKLIDANRDLRRTIKTMKEEHEAETERLKANGQLSEAHKRKFENDLEIVNQKNRTLQDTLISLRRQLEEKDSSLEQLQRDLQRIKIPPVASSTWNSDKARDYEATVAKAQKEANLARTERNYAISKYEESQRQLDETRKEAEKLKTHVRGLSDQIQTLSSSDQSGSQAAKTIELTMRLEDSRKENTELKGRIRDLDLQFGTLEQSISEQKKTLLQLQAELSVSESDRKSAEKRVSDLEFDNEGLFSKVTLLNKDNERLKLGFQQTLDECEALRLAARKHLEEIEEYQRQLGEKEAERSGLLAQLQDMSMDRSRLSPMGGSDVGGGGSAQQLIGQLELKSIRDEMHLTKLENERLKDERQVLEASLRAVSDQLDGERRQKESFWKDLAAVRTQLLGKDNDLLLLQRQTQQLQDKLNSMKSYGSDLKAELEAAKTAAANAASLAPTTSTAKDLQDAMNHLADARQQLVQQQQTIRRLEDELEQSKQDLRMCREQIDALQNDMQNERLKRKILRARLGSETSSTDKSNKSS